VHQDRYSVPTHLRDIGMVFQNYAVWPHKNVFDNVAFPLTDGARQKVSKADVRTRVERALEVVGLKGLEGRMSTQLSGGQQQRLSFARAIVREPKVLLLDEPLSNLDAKLRERMRRDLSILHTRLGITTLFVTHDQIEALSMSDRIGVMRDGQIVQEGTPEEIYHHPVDEFVATFIGTTNLIRGTVRRLHDDVAEVETPLGLLRGLQVGDMEIGTPVTMAVRPEEIDVRAPSTVADDRGAVNRLDGRVIVGLFSGSFVEYEVDVAGTAIGARSGSRGRLPKDSEVALLFAPEACRVFPRLATDPSPAEQPVNVGHDH
jgi:iron(III) transport system ATP-binding protein